MEIGIRFLDTKGIDLTPIKRQLQGLVNRTAGEAETISKESMTGVKHGRFYKIPGAKHTENVTKVYQASAPGEAPAIRPGRLGGKLFGSIRMKPATGDSLTAFVLVGARHGIFGEFGTRNMEPRPFLGPAIEAVTPDFNSNAQRFLGLAQA